MKPALTLLSLFATSCSPIVHTHAERRLVIDGALYDDLPSDACMPKVGTGIDPKYAEECRRMSEPKRWRGLWRRGFELSLFCPEPAPKCTMEEMGKEPVFWFGSSSSWPAELEKKAQSGRLFRVEFIGRRTIYRGMHGHMGIFDHEIVVDQMISMQTVER